MYKLNYVTTPDIKRHLSRRKKKDNESLPLEFSEIVTFIMF